MSEKGFRMHQDFLAILYGIFRIWFCWLNMPIWNVGWCSTNVLRKLLTMLWTTEAEIVLGKLRNICNRFRGYLLTKLFTYLFRHSFHSITRFVTRLDALNLSGNSKPLRCDLRWILPCVWKREADAMLILKAGSQTVCLAGWVRKDRSPDQTRYGFVADKPPSANISPISTFGLGYPPIPFLWLYKDTKCILNIINKWGEMRFVHRWVSRFC